MGRPRAGHARPLQGGGIVLKRLVGSGLDRSGKVAGDGNRTRRHIYIPRNYAAAAQLRGGVKTPPYSTDDLATFYKVLDQLTRNLEAVDADPAEAFEPLEIQ